MTPPKKKPTVALQTQDTTPTDLLRIAVEGGADLESLERLWGLQLQWEANEARKEFQESMACFKEVCQPVFEKTKQVDVKKDGRTAYSYKHATLGGISEVVAPLLSKQGLSHSWNVEQPARGVVRVTCHVKHRRGHVESVTVEGPEDRSGGKNDIQAIASSITYLSRYSLKCVLGLAELDDEDDDGAAAGGQRYQEPQKTTRAPEPRQEPKRASGGRWPKDSTEGARALYTAAQEAETIARLDQVAEEAAELSERERAWVSKRIGKTRTAIEKATPDCPGCHDGKLCEQHYRETVAGGEAENDG